MIDFKMPSLGADMEKGTIVAWHVEPGTVVQKGDIIVDVETDKGTIAVDVWQSGKVADLLIKPGATVTVGTTIAHLEDSTSARDLEPTPVTPDMVPPSIKEEIPLEKKAPPTLADRKRRISPLAKRMAQDMGIDLDSIPGHQDGSPISKRDLEIFAEKNRAEVGSKVDTLNTTASRISSANQSERLRSAIATLMTRSQREIPHYFVESEINLSKAMSWLDNINGARQIQDRLLPIVPIIKAIAISAKRVGSIHGFYQNGKYQTEEDIRLGVVLSLRTGGIVNPALHSPDTMSLDDIMRSLMDLIQRARHGKLKSSEVTGQTLTITSLGDLGSDRVMGLIYPPQVALVGVGRIRHRPWANGVMIGSVPTVHITLAGDHRVSDGLKGASFIGVVDTLLQDPEKLL
jgi:pyruvate dehydrogenase E2 component (dihydrolipoamide acetyltransferase)